MPIKNGIYTTEFWLTAIISGWSMFGAALPAPWNLLLPTIATGLYSIARGLSKAGMVRGTIGKDLSQEK